MDGIPRLRMFAGPNGSGKTTIKKGLDKSPQWFGLYINPDELEAEIRRTGRLALQPLGLSFPVQQLQAYFSESTLLGKHHLTSDANALRGDSQHVDFSGLTINSYHASVLADFLRRQALRARRTFSFETVMSSPDKVQLLEESRQAGYRNYLYFVATADPQINIQRIANRVKLGGHDVPAEKIRARHARCLSLLAQALPLTHRAFLFDTSEDTDKPWYFAQVTDGVRLELTSERDEIPIWFEPIWNLYNGGL